MRKGFQIDRAGFADLTRTPDAAGLAANKRELYRLCSQFIIDNSITSPECIYQMDNVVANAYEFIDEMCGIIGYAEPRDESDPDADDFD